MQSAPILSSGAAAARVDAALVAAPDDSPLTVARVTRDGRWGSVGGLCGILGHPPEDLADRPIWERVHPDDAVAVRT